MLRIRFSAFNMHKYSQLKYVNLRSTWQYWCEWWGGGGVTKQIPGLLELFPNNSDESYN